MFSSLFGKRRSSPVEDDNPPIPGPRSDDGFEIIGGASAGGGLYPSFSGYPAPAAPYPQRQAPPPPLPKTNTAEQTFHYLQGVPFSLSRELKMASNKEAFASEISDLMALFSNKIDISSYEYDFSAERSVLKEC